jgi:hypothetical protein
LKNTQRPHVRHPNQSFPRQSLAHPRLHRHDNLIWLGIDQSVMAVKVTEQRLQEQNGGFEVIMMKPDVEKIPA